MNSEVAIGILFMLLSKKRVRASEVSDRFGISRRTVYRYIDEMSTFVPVYTVRGPHGGFSVTDSFRLPATFLTEKEYSVAINALEAFSRELPGEEISSVIDKMKANNKAGKDDFTLTSSSLMIDSGPWGVTSDYNNKLRVLEECVEKCVEVEIVYSDLGGKLTQRRVEPHTLVLKQGMWYIYAFCLLRGEFRLFKVGRIRSIKVLEKSFVRRKVDGLKEVFLYRTTAPDTQEVALEVSSRALPEIEEWLGVECIKKSSNVISARAFLPVDNGLISKILSFGGEVKVVSPSSLKERIKTVINGLAAKYN